MPWEFCSIKDAVQGFLTGTERDPTVANSRCVIYFPDLQNQFNNVIGGVNATLVVPTNFVGWLIDVVALINRYALWQNYCVFATLFTRLDNIMTLEGLTTVFSRGLINSGLLTTHFASFNTAWTGSQCIPMMKAAGTIFSILLDFNVPEDIV